MIWTTKKFTDLSLDELYAILQLRNEVFAIEQNCVYPDMDDKDQPSYHLSGWDHEKLLAYTRIIPPGIVYDEPSIGRVVTAPCARRAGTGKELMQRSIAEVERLFGKVPIRIGAQVYLRKFYSSFGFTTTSEIYLEDGIEHVEMKRG